MNYFMLLIGVLLILEGLGATYMPGKIGLSTVGAVLVVIGLARRLRRQEIAPGNDEAVEVRGDWEVAQESQLQGALVQNFSQFFPDLTFIGKEYATNAGPIDILAKDEHDGYFVILELKKGMGSDQVIGQILRYMGAISEKFATQKVSGIIVARAEDSNLRYAVAEVADKVSVQFYSAKTHTDVSLVTPGKSS